jgi:hypothetical protein
MLVLMLGVAPAFADKFVVADTFKDVKYFHKAEGKEKAEPVDGSLYIDGGAQMIVFKAKETSLAISTMAVTNLVYERTARPRYAEGILIAWPLLFTKSKQHYLTIQYAEQDQRKYAMFRLDKGNCREILAAVEAATGRKVERSEER